MVTTPKGKKVIGIAVKEGRPQATYLGGVRVFTRVLQRKLERSLSRYGAIVTIPRAKNMTVQELRETIDGYRARVDSEPT